MADPLSDYKKLDELDIPPLIYLTIGMSDLLAPLLYIVNDEANAFWCFTKLMEISTLCKPGRKQVSIKHQLVSSYD